jgi:hypothetical protein
VKPIAAAIAAARDLVKERAEAAAAAAAPIVGEPAAPAEPVVPVEIPEDETDEERVAREAAALEGDTREDGEPDPALTVIIDGAREGEAFPLVVDSIETADRVRQLQRAALRGDQARAIRDQGIAAREEAEEFTYVVEMDPAGVIGEAIKSPTDRLHLSKFLLTRPGVLQALEPWLVELLNDPDKLQTQADIVEAERIRRRDAVQGQVEHRRAMAHNARQLVQSAERSIDSLVPEAWSEDSKRQMYQDVLADMRETNRLEMADAERRGLAHDGRMDPRRVPGMVQRRLSLLGVAPRAAKPVGAGAAPAGTPPAVKPGQTPETLKGNRTARRAVASAPTGAGSPAARIPKAPPYDPKQKGSPIEQAVGHFRRFASSLRKPT